MFEKLLNDPLLLTLVVVGFLAVFIGVFILVIKMPKIKESAARRKAAKAEKAASDAERRASATSLDQNLFASRDADAARKNENTQADAKDVLSILQREKKDIKKEFKKSKEDKFKEDQSGEVLSILKGNLSNTELYKKPDAIQQQKITEEQKAEEAARKAESSSVLGILNRSETTNKKIEKLKKEPKGKKPEGDSSGVGNVLDLLNGKKNG